MKRFLCLISALLFSGFIFAAPFKKIIVFGDSLSDTGNLWEMTNHKFPPTPPYFDGHFSNGKVWVEYLAEAYFPDNPKAHLSDYAFGGAGIIDEKDEDGVIVTLSQEIDTYLLAHDDQIDKDSLYVVWIGANNYLELRDPDETISLVIKGVKRGVEKLINKGARQILIVGLPDLGQSPFAHEMDAEKELADVCLRNNQALENLTQEFEIRYPEVKTQYFDISGFVNTILVSPQAFGFKNTTETCYNLSSQLLRKQRSNQILKMSARLQPRSDNPNCEGYLFFDPVHPTTKAHKLVAAQIKSFLESKE